MTVIREDDVIASVAERVCNTFPITTRPDFIQAMGKCLCGREKPVRARRDRADIDQFAHVRRRASAHLSGHGHRRGVRESGHGRDLEQRTTGSGSHDQRGRAPGLHRTPTINCAPPSSRIRHSQRIQYARQYAGGDPYRTGDPASTVEITVAAKGGGSENTSRFFAMLNPVRFRGRLGLGYGAGDGCRLVSARHARRGHRRKCRKGHAVGERIPHGADRHRVNCSHVVARTQLEELRLEIYQRVNALGIGAQGLGGLTTVLDVKVMDYPTHAASLPVAVIPNCAATRHIHFVLDGSGPAVLEPPDLDLWPKVEWRADASARRVSLDGLTREEMAAWKVGERLLLSGKLLTGRDAAHKRICALLDAGKPLPDGLDFTGRVIYYVGPVDPVGTEVVGPAGPTTATRMDRFTETMLAKSGLLAMVGKAERGPDTVQTIAKYRSAYLIAVGGAAFLVSNAIRSSRVVAFPELGMEAVYEFEVRDMPVTVAVTSDGDSVHESGPKAWRGRFAGIPVTVE